MTTQSNQPESLIDYLAKRREVIAYAGIAFAIIMFAAAVLMVLHWDAGRAKGGEPPAQTQKSDVNPPEKKVEAAAIGDRGDFVWWGVWSGIVGVFFSIGALWLLTRGVSPTPTLDLRYVLVIVGGGVGMFTTVLGFTMAWRWQDSLVRWINDGQTTEAKWVLFSLAIFVFGLIVMFVAMQAARAEERSNVVLRRLLYGSNAILTGLLVLLGLAAVNVFVFLKLPENVITSTSGFQGLSDSSKEFLHTINEDVQLYMIMPERNRVIPDWDRLYADTRALITQCRQENNRIKSVVLSPAIDGVEIKKLLKEAKLPESSQPERIEYGILIRYGSGSEQSAAFIPYFELALIDPRSQRIQGFQGENRLMTELNFLAGGSKRPIIYFTQDNAEPTLPGPKAPAGLRSTKMLVEYLTDRKFEVRPLVIEPGRPVNLSDAAMVVVSAPRRPFTKEQVQILESYMIPRDGSPGGKLVALLPAFPGPDGKVSPTGLEDLLMRFGVKCEPKRRLFCEPQRGIPSQFVLGTFADQARMRGVGLTRILAPDVYRLFGNVRPIEALPPQGVDRLHGVDLFASMHGLVTYQDEIYDSNPEEVFAKLIKEAEQKIEATAKEKLVTASPVPFGVLVTQSSGNSESPGERPRLLVIGTDSFSSDDALIQTRTPKFHLALMGTMLEVVRERPQGMNIQPKAVVRYTLKGKDARDGSLYLPVGLVLLGIVAFGIGVWFTRQK